MSEKVHKSEGASEESMLMICAICDLAVRRDALRASVERIARLNEQSERLLASYGIVLDISSMRLHAS